MMPRGGSLMPIHPIESRYGSKEMRNIFEYDNRIRIMARVEAELARVEAELGIIPKEAADVIGKAAEMVTSDLVREEERIVKHETMALVRAISKLAGDYGEYVHYGATSNDILDTAMAIQLRDASKIIISRMLELTEAIIKRGRESLDFISLGRTHGMAAIPMPFGFKFALWASIMKRNIDRYELACRRAVKGKFSGAIGTMASLGRIGMEIQRKLMERLGLESEEITTQIVPRDELCELLLTMALISSTLEMMANEIRNLHRSEIAEVTEPFEEEQVGSSTMPHKVNPINSEKVCGLARVMRGIAVASLENVVIEHERDLTNSSVERIIIPEAFLLLEEQLITLNYVVRNMKLNSNAMKENIERTKGFIMAERVMMELSKSLGRQKSHETIRRISMEAMKKGITFEEALLRSEVSKYLTPDEIHELLKPENYLGMGKEIAESVFNSVEEFIRKKRIQ
ncbi:MAG: adenylosuccinate lyase [Thermoproteota archaeon]|jgi:adenylosuccinate lyase|uniref:Adenylosuccinate lyase n=2 Tax=Candidatus Methanodesulfokora washburnensis TaxID=2478471 RepID=A0A3R9PW99_9CREN|nr:adenylosuccinate lyase [Candidatus Methanodesulfokores washburnensis]RZN63052.1 MAG: adenylosuccinate lyase [Candidatus Methanodesulfokores washburnensis]TDA40978.1 MAG: adenylosuccinate lyase [Candidatus Korarchaeota archaeon]